MRPLIFTILIFFSVKGLNSQIIGNISDDQNNKLEYGTIVLFEQETNNQIGGVISNIKGDFIFKNIKNGKNKSKFIESEFGKREF
jgi:hypothetical protein